MRVLLSRAASQEMADAFHYYEQEQAGLGHRFLDEVDFARQLIYRLPLAWHPLSAEPTSLLITPFSLRPNPSRS